MIPLHCWLFGHDDLRQLEPHRIYLRCQTCRRETPGWRDDDADIPRPRVVYGTPVRRKFRLVKRAKRATVTTMRRMA